jgi:hypothetical protein
MNWNFAALLTSFSQVKIVNSTVVVDIGGERIDVASLDTVRGKTGILGYDYRIDAGTDGITNLLSEIEAAPQPCANNLPFCNAIVDRRFPTFAKWVADSENYASVDEYLRSMYKPSRYWTNQAKRDMKLEIHNMIADYLRAADEFLAGEPSYSLHPEIDEAIARLEEREQQAAENAQEPAQEPAQPVAEVQPTETSVEPMTARERKMRRDLMSVLSHVQNMLKQYDYEGAQLDEQGAPIDRPEASLAEEMADLIESVLGGSDVAHGGLNADDWHHLETLDPDQEIDVARFAKQVAEFRRHHYNDGAWDVPAGSSIDAECELIREMDSFRELKVYLDYSMGNGEFWAQVDYYLEQDHRPSPEDMDPDDVLKYVLEFSAMHTENGRGFDLLNTSEADQVLREMNDDSAYLERFTDRARVIMLARTLDIAVPAAS